LPQGTPLSPLLTNLIMVHYDYMLYQALKNFENQYYAYTRYADDLLISCKYKFDKEKIVELVKRIITPFNLNENKIRFGSTAGRNWNLGLMLNKDNNITIGYKKKQRFKAALFSFLQDFTNGTRWSKIDTQVLVGQLAYYQKIEPEYAQHILDKYNEKFNLNFRECVKEILR
jgi:intein-encoded DNA endonuclease-like protein